MNVVNNLLTQEGELKTICLAGDIISPNGTAKEQCKALIQSFSEGARLLERWSAKLRQMFKDHPKLERWLNTIPASDRLCVTRLLGSYFSTDTCNTATLLQKQFEADLVKRAWETGCTDMLYLNIGNCHNHIRNIWSNALEK